MLKRSHKFITLSLIATILLANLASALAQNVSVEVADSMLISQPALTSQDLDKSVCVITKVQEYVSKLGTPNLTNADFEALVKCGDQAVPALSQAFRSENRDTRASAAYALGEIAVRQNSKSIIRILNAFDENKSRFETDPDVLQIINSYRVVGEECDNPFNIRVRCHSGSQVRKLVQAQTIASSPIICSLPGIRTIFPRCK